MKNEKIIKQIAQPILEQLEKYENQFGKTEFRSLPEIHFVLDKTHDGPVMIEDIELTDELLEELETYIQEQIEAKHKPTILH
ncbi:hypothetical protein [Faecalicoccus pleomorphus]|uniref:hypothetical protein n=1 Tax=Faecalicoccus pleomorphus TaxID=1323 RepID=UPI0019620B6A|nr:hypothetical protein [Faecalicoccus pleomorphus]MBM6808974.1 hypothetical protein [Faecalicoccus pleomorphus]